MFLSALVISGLIVAVKTWQCASPIRKAYSRVNSDAVLKFYVELTSFPITFDFKFYNGSTKARIIYDSLNEIRPEALSGFNITGDSAGNVIVTLSSVQESHAGVYILADAVFTTCTCLYILGIPEKPTITVDKTPSESGSVTLTCSGASTTKPSNHSLSLNYNWTEGNKINPNDTKYTYSSHRNKLTVNNVTRDDAYKQFTCSAKEDVTDGYTSANSDPFSFDVYYGPDSARVNVTSPYYLTEGDTLAIECMADCYPGCSYTWTNESSGSVIIASDALLYIDSVDIDMTGDYKCTSKNTAASYTKNTNIVVSINIKERTLVKWFYIGSNVSQTTVTVDEKDVDVTFTCNISGDPATHARVMLNGKTLKEETQTNSLVYVLERVTCFDTGVYQCESRSREMQVSRRYVPLFVKCSPRPLRKTRENITSPLDEPVTLTFDVLAYPEPGQSGFTWYKKREIEWIQILSNEDFDIVSSKLVTNLTIFSVSESDFGQYRVTSENVIGSYAQYFRLLPGGYPKEEKEESNCNSTLIASIALGIICAISTTYAATITIVWKRNSTSKKDRNTNCTDQDTDRSTKQTAYVNVAHTSNVEQTQERSPQNIGGEAAYEDVSNKTQYTELDTLSREKNDTMYDIIKRE